MSISDEDIAMTLGGDPVTDDAGQAAVTIRRLYAAWQASQAQAQHHYRLWEHARDEEKAAHTECRIAIRRHMATIMGAPVHGDSFPF